MITQTPHVDPLMLDMDSGDSICCVGFFIYCETTRMIRYSIIDLSTVNPLNIHIRSISGWISVLRNQTPTDKLTTF